MTSRGRAGPLCSVAARAYLLVPALGSLGGCRDTGGGQAAPTFGGTEDWTSHETPSQNRSILMLGRGVIPWFLDQVESIIYNATILLVYVAMICHCNASLKFGHRIKFVKQGVKISLALQ